MQVPAAVSEVVARGEGGVELAQTVLAVLDPQEADFRPLYDWNQSVQEKLEILATEIYGADGVDYSEQAQRDLRDIKALGVENLPLCVAKTQHSLSDDPSRTGAPVGWRLHVQEIRLSLGAGFLVPLTGSVLTMPGLPKRPAAEAIDIDAEGNVTGLF